MGRLSKEEKEKAAATVRGSKRKGIAKSWMVVLETGESRVEDIDKHSIMQRTGLPARDLRVFDTKLSQPSSILGRAKAIIVNLEHIRAIITSNEVLMINSTDPFFIRFLQDLQKRILLSNNIQTPKRGSDGIDSHCEVKPLLEELLPSVQGPTHSTNNESIGVAGASAPKQLPFEFKALESCIESACTYLEYETQRLEEETYPALGELTSRISTLNLERVRQIKTRLVALSGRVHKVVDQIENLLDDDNDMAEMYLTQKLDAHLSDETSVKEAYDSAFDEDIDKSEKSYSDTYKSYDPKPDVEELEMLLEAYFAQINGILQKLSTLSEYVNNTEDYINIMLDDKQNQLLQASIILNTINFIVNLGIVVVGVFGMNIHIDLYEGQPSQFWATTGGTVLGCVLLFRGN